MPTNHSNDFGNQSLNEQEEGFNFSIQHYAIVVFLINTSCTMLQIKYQTQDATPFDTHSVIMLTFFLIMYAYAVILVAEIKLQNQSSSYRKILGRMSLFMGALATILPLLILVPAVGWLNLALWAICFVKMAKKSWQEFWLLLYHAILEVLELLMKKLMNQNQRPLEQQNRMPV